MDTNVIIDRVDAIALFITSPLFIWIWCAGVAAYTFRWLVRLKWESVQIAAELSSAIDAVSRCKDHESFARDFSDLNVCIARLGRLSRPWKEFCQTLIRPSEDGHEASMRRPYAMRASREPGEFFADHSVIQPSIDLRFYGAIPNHLTGLGILGTFCGLAAGIYLARTGLAGGMVDELRESLGSLLSGASLAFWTSIIGVLSSIVFSKIEKTAIKSLRNKIETLNTYLSCKIQFVSVEQIANEKLEEHIKHNSYLCELVGQVETLQQNQRQLGEKSLLRVVEEFRKALSQSAGTEFRSMALAIKSIHEALSQTRQVLDGVGERFETAAQAASQHFEEKIVLAANHFRDVNHAAADAMAGSFERTTKAMTQSIEEAVGITAQQLEQPVVQLLARAESMTDKSTIAIEQLGKIIAINQRQYHEILSAQEKGAELVSPIIEATRNMCTIFRDSDAVLRQSNESSKAISCSVERIEMIQNRLEIQWQAYCHRFEQVDDQLQNSIKTTNSSLENYSEKVRNFTTDLDKHMSKGILTLAGAVGDLHQVVGHLPDAIREAR